MTDDAHLSPLDEDLRALVDRTRRIAPAPAASRARVLARVEALLDPSPGGGDGGGAQVAPRPAVSRPTSLLRRIAPIAASFVLGTGFGAFAMHERERERPDPAAVPIGSASPLPVGSAPSFSAVPSAPAAAPSMGEAAPHASVEKAHTPAPSAAPIDQLTAERSLLDVARGALEREDPQAALQATARHEHRYPSGILAQEREAMAVRALVALDRVPEARARVDLFRRRFPESVLLPTLEDVIRERGPLPRP